METRRQKRIAVFWSRVDKNWPTSALGCWRWIPTKHEIDYGRFRLDDEIYVHRVSWVLAFGKIPFGRQVLHHCDNPWCVNPDHLFLGTNADNVKDRVSKGRPGGGRRSKISQETVNAVFKRYQSQRLTARQIAEEFQLSLKIAIRLQRLAKGQVKTA